MAERRVTKTGKDRDGDITKLCNPASAWRSRSKVDAIRDIENGAHSYYVNEAGQRAEVCVVMEGRRKYLRTTKDSTSANNLDNLPDC